MRLDFRSDAAIGAESVSIAHPDGATLAVLTPWKRTLLPGFDASEFTATQSFVTSDDGTAQLPIFVVRRKTASSSPRPTLLYGYGGFSEALRYSGCLFALHVLHLITFSAALPRRCQLGTVILGNAPCLAARA